MKRLLFFGAYGNGNLGDELQASSLERIVSKQYPSAQLTFASHLRSPAARRKFAPARELVSTQYDHILIGGGGLLAHPHWPLRDDWWQPVSVPYSFISIGASRETVPKAKQVLRGAAHVGVRNETTKKAISSLRVCFDMADPVLADDFYRPRTTETKKHKTCWVLNPGHKLFQTRVLSILTKELQTNDIILGIEPALDTPLNALPFSCRKTLSNDIEEVQSIMQTSTRVVSMRLHGAILAHKWGIPFTTRGGGKMKEFEQSSKEESSLVTGLAKIIGGA
jgi:hypothetical protein